MAVNRLNCVPAKVYTVKSQPPKILECDTFCRCGLHRDNQVKMRSLDWALIQYDQYPKKKKKFGHRHTQREDNMKTEAENGHPEARERGLESIFPSSASQEPNLLIVSSLQICETIRLSLHKALNLWYYGSPRKLIQWQTRTDRQT